MSIISIGQIDADVVRLITELDLSTVPMPWREDFVRLKNRIESPRVYMKDNSAMALCCLLLSQKLSVPLQYIYEPTNKKESLCRIMALFIGRDVLSWQDQGWIAKYFDLNEAYYTYASEHLHSPKYNSYMIAFAKKSNRDILKEMSEKAREVLIQIYKSY